MVPCHSKKALIGNFDARRDWTGDFGGPPAACPPVADIAVLVLSVNPEPTARDARVRRKRPRRNG